MAERIPQSVAKNVVFRAFLASDGKTPATGKTIAVTISKNTGAFANPAAGSTSATEISSGFYYFALGTGDTATLGPLAWRGVEATINDAADVLEVAKATNAGFTGVPDAAANGNGGLPILSISGTTLAYTLGTLTTYTGNTPQTGDAYGQLNTLIGHAFTYDGSSIPYVDASSAGLLHVDVSSINGVSASNVTTINQVIGQLHEIATTVAGLVTFSNTSIGVSGTVVLDATQPNYAPAKAGNQMDLVNAPNATAVAALQSGTATATALGSVATSATAAASSAATAATNTGTILTAVGGTPVDGKAIAAALQIILATVAGKISGAGSGTETFVGADGATTRVTVTVDALGNRTGVVYS